MGETLIDKMAHWAQQQPDRKAMHQRHGDDWLSTTWSEYYTIAKNTAKGLISLGLKHGECVAMIAGNRPEFLYAQFGIVAAGGIPAPIYTNSNAEQTAYIIEHCKAKIVFVENEEQYQKVNAKRDKLKLEKVILMEPIKSRDYSWTLSFDELLIRGKETEDQTFSDALKKIKSENHVLLIYTSGTTGHPKAVILTHDNLLSTAKICFARYPQIGATRVVSYLPMSHIAEQLITNIALLQTGGEAYFCTDLNSIKDYLLLVKPNIFLGVPRVWEKFAQAIKEQFAKLKGVKKLLVNWAVKTESYCFQKGLQKGIEIDTFSRRMANKIVLSKIRNKLGFEKLLVAITGAAPISIETQEFMASLGIVVYDVYGMSETAGIIAAGVPGKPRFGTVGIPFDGVEVKLADDGEILVRGPNTSQGYLHDQEGTEQLLEGGWLHTGDIGTLEEDGHLKITDRKKALLITAGGKNVAPLPIEMLLVAIPGIESAVVVGDRKPYLVALVTLNPEEASRVAKKQKIAFDKAEDLVTNQKLCEYLQTQVEEKVNSQLARYETVKKIAILPGEFSVEGGELTPTMKIKRKVIVEKYSVDMESLYEK